MIGFSVLALLAPATAAVSPTSAPTVRYVMDPAEGKVECRRIEVAYSRIPERVCRTTLQWEELAQETQEDLRKAASRSRGDAH